MKLNRTRVLAWCRYWQVKNWWWGPLLLLAIGLRACSRDAVYVPPATTQL